MSKRKVIEVLAPPVKLLKEEKIEIQTQFRAAVDAEDLEKVANALYLHSYILGAPNNPERVNDTNIGSSIDDSKDVMSKPSIGIVACDPMFHFFTKAMVIVEKWKQTVSQGDNVDCYRTLERKWYTAKILAREGDTVSLHYNGWAPKHDDICVVFSQIKMYPCGTAVRQKKKAVKKETRAKYEIVEIPLQEKVAVDSSAISSSSIESAPSRSGRQARAARLVPADQQQLVKKPIVKRQKTKEEEDLEDSLRREWVCSICYQLEAPDDSDLILCDGLCKRSFHLMCLNLSEVTILHD
jgi:hypothetical protein